MNQARNISNTAIRLDADDISITKCCVNGAEFSRDMSPAVSRRRNSPVSIDRSHDAQHHLCVDNLDSFLRNKEAATTTPRTPTINRSPRSEQRRVRFDLPEAHVKCQSNSTLAQPSQLSGYTARIALALSSGQNVW
eukprot:CAMPEP_0113690592 /NCGR_PEP_ID=MMETSP0038_2-20120614/17886_1 /TAXON_ID=2898 /ORGANISM="Cryptomonas paramecium" /LENGTH=135 /DNA_ID=CAMNT_0000611953 /DNA_START=21 /DNA_END=425 /DNA_ORIENTATION=+ /assembly_acc=CAM_ASM_000170